MTRFILGLDAALLLVLSGFLFTSPACSTSVFFHKGAESWAEAQLPGYVRYVMSDSTLDENEKIERVMEIAGLQCTLDEDSGAKASPACNCAWPKGVDHRRKACGDWAIALVTGEPVVVTSSVATATATRGTP